ncbi:DUF4214 domain-containing protein [Salipiger sp.]|uniref:DUF4214 domain-containing protein n=1 Tax=Salipiger sp. TaxID=2078585 RepID=UPI003A97FB33
MVQLRHLGTVQAAQVAPDRAAHMVGLSALLLWSEDSGEGADPGNGAGDSQRLFSASGAGGGVLGWAPGLTSLGAGSYGGSPGHDAPRGLVRAEVDGESLLLAPGRFGAGIEAWVPDAGGALGARQWQAFDDGLARALVAVQPVGDLLLTAARGRAGLEVWRPDGERLIAQPQDAQVAAPGQISAIAHVGQGPSARVLALSTEKNSLCSWAISSEGQLSDRSRIGVADGLYLETPTHLALVEVAEQSYALIGAGSGHIAVVALAPDGAMRVVDLVADDLATRFAGVTALTVMERQGRVYVAAAGSDDGLTLMTLLPGGRLLHLATQADDTATALSNPAALALAAEGTGLAIYAAGGVPGDPESDGLSRLHAELGPVGVTRQLGGGDDRVTGSAADDQIHGGAGGDSLSGGAGDDVLIDGPGQDRLSGGPGADVFVLLADGKSDRITDFEPGVDRIDLSDLGRFYTLEALQFHASARGVRIVLNGDSTRIDSADGTPLGPEDVTLSGLRDLWHIDSTPLPDPPPDPPEPPEDAPTDAHEDGPEDGPDTDDGPEEPPEDDPADETPTPPEPPPDPRLAAPFGALWQGGAGDDLLTAAEPDPGFDPVAAQVYRLYRATLDRAPDMTGLLNWSGRLLSGEQDLLSVVAGFTRSQEFRERYGALSDAAFVTQLYHNVLGRAPDAQGLENWTERLEDGMSRERVVLGFSDSAEFMESSAAGAAGFAREAQQQDQLDDVFRLYRAVLDRASDAAGLENWSARLEAGMSRAQVVQGFAQSAEFIAASAPDLLEWMRGRGIEDVLEGGGGRNGLVGGFYADRFVFRASDRGGHEVADLERWDVLAFEGFGYETAADLRAHLVQQDSAMVFSDQGSRVVLHGTGPLDLHDDMFVF